MSIRRINSGTGHRYVDTDTGARVPGVTTRLDKGVPKPGLINWAASATIDYAIDNWADLSKLPISERIKRLSRARSEDVNQAARKGSLIHKLGQRLVWGEQVEIPEGLEGYVEGYARFLDDFLVEPILVEAVVVSHQYGYCGTLDLLADLDDGELARWLLDLKTSRSRVYGEAALQLAPYRFADAYIDADGQEQPIPEVSRTGVVWVTPTGSQLIPVVAEEEQFRQFLYVVEVAKFIDDARDLIGDPIDPPRKRSTYRLERS